MGRVLLLLFFLTGAVTYGQDCDPAVSCLIECPWGRVRDANGCEICQCIEEACKDKVCEPGKVCIGETTDTGEKLNFCVYPESGNTSPINLPSECLLPIMPGPCTSAQATRWGYNPSSGACETFVYGGCHGNGNSFEKEDDCLEYCQPIDPSSIIELCQLPADPGPCEFPMLNWFYNPERGACQQFYYGGCDGNDNNFETHHDCDLACHPDPGCSPISCLQHCKFGYKRDDRGCEICDCLQGPDGDTRCKDIDDCSLECPQGYHIDVHGCPECRCVHVCPTLECDVTCPLGYANDDDGCITCDCINPLEDDDMAQCHQPPDVGPCEADITRYYYNPHNAECEEFLYGGCEGNSNNFKSHYSCDIACRPDKFVPKAGCRPVLCRMHCPYGRMKDDQGCEICHCIESKSDFGNRTSCPDLSQCGLDCEHGLGTDDHGCHICVCEPSRGCEAGHPTIDCQIHCANGFKSDSAQCPMCECLDANTGSQCPAVSCDLFCPYGFRKDAHGCDMCACVAVPDCADTRCSACDEFGYRRDQFGCPTCECRTAEDCSPQRCLMECPYGFTKDEEGCSLCFCEEPCDDHYCGEEAICHPVKNKETGIFEPHCLGSDFISERPWCEALTDCGLYCPDGLYQNQYGCPICECREGPPPKCPVVCSDWCPYGYMYDKDGCHQCECLPNPCEESPPCKAEQVCEAVPRDNCDGCPSETRCMHYAEVKRLRLRLVFAHPPVEEIQHDIFASKLQTLISELMNINPGNIIGIRVEPLSRMTTAVHFHVLADSHSTNLVEAYHHLQNTVLSHQTRSTFTIGETRFTPEEDTMVASFSSETEMWEERGEESNIPDDMEGDQVVLIAAVVAACVVVVAAIVIFTVIRRHRAKKAEKKNRNVKYSRTGQHEEETRIYKETTKPV